MILRTRFKFSLRTLLLATLALGALGTAYVHWNPFVPFAHSKPLNQLNFIHSTIEFSPDGERLLFLIESGVWLWDLKSDPVPLNTKPALSYVSGAKFSEDGASVIAFNHETIARFTLEDAAQSLIADMAIPPEKGVDKFQAVAILSVSNNAEYTLVEETTQVRTASGGIGTLSDAPRFIQIRTCADGKIVSSFPTDIWAVDVANITADGRRCCWVPFGGGSTILTMFDAGTQDVTSLRPQMLNAFQGRLALTSDGGATAYACFDKCVEIVDLNRMQVLERVNIPGAQAAYLSPDGSRLATLHDRKSFTIWKARRKPGAFGPLDFPELWLAIAFGAFFLASLIGDLFTLRRSRLQALRPAETARSAQLTNPPPTLSPNGAE